jgi:hypothetical protein
MKYPVLFGGLLGGSILASMIVLTMSFPMYSFIEDPLSTIANIPNIMPFFGPLATLMGVFLALFVYSAFNHFGELDKKVKIILGSTFIMGLLMIWIPYNDIQLFFKWLHTFAGLGMVGGLIWLGYEFNKRTQLTSKTLQKIRDKVPPAIGIGTAGIMIVTGINILMQFYIVVLMTFWLIVAGITIKER